MRTLELIVPGDLSTATGGYRYDRRMAEGLRALGWEVRVHALDESFPIPTPQALAHASDVFASLEDGARVLVDGLAFGALPGVAERESARLRLAALVHHPLARETGLDPPSAAALEDSEKAALRAARCIVTTSARTRLALQSLGLDAACIEVVEPGTERGTLTSRSGSRTLRLLCVATLAPRKGHALLFEALAGLRSHEWQLVCVGSERRDPATASSLRARFLQLGLEGRVRLVGEVDDAALEMHYLTADCFVLPTLYEGYGMAVAEALAHGIPVIATATGAIPELLADGAGLLLPPRDLEALRGALERLMTSPELLAKLGAGARARRERLHGWAEAAARLSAVLERGLA